MSEEHALAMERQAGSWRTSIVTVVALTSAMQALMAFAGMILASIAPEAAASLGVPTAYVGYQVSLIFGCGIVTSMLAGDAIQRWGACRTSQASLVVATAGCLLITVPNLAAVALGSALVGLAYGFTNPAGAHLLHRFAPPGRRNLVFSIKQAGVPLGGVLAGVMGPAITLAFGWHWVAYLGAALILATTFAAEAVRGTWDDDRGSVARLCGRLFQGLRLVAAIPTLRWLSLSGIAYLFVQLSLSGFTVATLVEDVQLSLVEAGLMLAVVQTAAAVGRIGWGWLADRHAAGPAILVLLGIIMSACAVATAFMTPVWSLSAVGVLLFAFGASAVGWNGIYYAEIARHAPPGTVAAATGGALALGYLGILLGPAAFSLIHGLTGSYTMTFGVFGSVSLIGTAFAFASRRAAIRRQEPT